MKNAMFKVFTFIIVVFFSQHAFAQQNVYSRDVATTGNWWDASNPWYRDCDGWWIDRPDRSDCNNNTTIGRNNVFIGHNNNTIMTVNGAWFQLTSLTLQGSATANRTFNNNSGGISLSTGIYNESTGDHSFNVPIGVDGTTVVFNAISGDLSFTTDFYLNANTASFLGSSNIIVSGIMSGSNGKVTKSGTGTMTLSGGNTYTGLTTVSGGILVLNRAGGSTIPSDNSVSVNGGTLQISSNQTLDDLTLSSGTLTVDANVTLTVNGTLTFSGGSISGSGTIAYGTNGALVYAQSTDGLNHTPGIEWASSAGPKNITLNLTGSGSPKINVPGARTISGSMTLTNGTLVIPSTASLTVIGSLSNAVGQNGLIIQSDASGTGSLISNGVNATVARYISASDNLPRPWHMISSPVSAKAFKPEFVPTTVATDFDFFYFNEAATTNPWINIRNSDNTSYAAWSTGNFVVGKGYLANYDLSVYGTDHLFSGTLNAGNKSISLTYTAAGGKGYNLIGNPYPASIDWSKVVKTSLASNYYYAWDPEANSGAGAYLYHNGITGSTGATKYIAPQQGFFVNVSEDVTFTFSDDIRAHSSETLLKDSPEVDEMSLILSDGIYVDEAKLGIYQEAEFNTDRNDAVKMYGFTSGVPSLYSITSDQTEAAYNTIPELPVVPIQLGVVIPTSGQYSISLAEVKGVFNYADIILEDVSMGIQHNFRNSPSYTFTASPDMNTQRFRLRFGNVGTLTQVKPETEIFTLGKQLSVYNAGKSSLEIFSLNGQLVNQIPLNKDEWFQTTLNVKPGYYLVRLIGSEDVKVQKVYIK